MKNHTTILLLLGCFGLLSPKAFGILPPPDGGYPGQNTAEGQSALLHLAGGAYNTALGWASLGFNVTGNFNTGVGAAALLNNTASENTATGAGALLTNSTGSSNTAIGAFALLNNNIGNSNTAIGYQALLHNTGGANTAIGYAALLNNTTGDNNTVLGALAGNNIATANNVIAIGNGAADVSSTAWIGNVYGVTTQSGMTAPVIVSDTGQLGTAPSSERFKKDVAEMDKTSEMILSLRPVTFRYKSDTKSTPQFGLIAEAVAKVNPVLVLPDNEGKPYTVRYDAVNAMLLNEFLKEHRRVDQLERRIEEQDRTAAQLRKEMQTVVAHAKEQDAKIQRVSGQLAAASPFRGELEMSTTTPNIVLNNP
jgi:hypothetical protein